MIDIYSTREPQLAFHQRISFCLDIHNMSVKVRSPGLQRRCLAATCPAPHPRVPQGRLAWFGAQFPDHLCKITGGPEGAKDFACGTTTPSLRSSGVWLPGRIRQGFRVQCSGFGSKFESFTFSEPVSPSVKLITRYYLPCLAGLTGLNEITSWGT